MTQEIDPAEERKELTTPEKSICEEIRDGAHAAVDYDEPDTDVEPEDKNVSGGPDGNLSGGE